MAIAKDAHNPTQTPGQQVDGASYQATVNGVQQYYNNVVKSQYQQAGIKQQKKD